jgi:hypothetical protein
MLNISKKLEISVMFCHDPSLDRTQISKYPSYFSKVEFNFAHF